MAYYYKTWQKRSKVFHEVGRNCRRRGRILEENLQVTDSVIAAASGGRRGCKSCCPTAEAILRCETCGGRQQVASVAAHRRYCACGGPLTVVDWLG